MKRMNVRKTERMFNPETSIIKILQVLYKYPEKEFSLSDLAKEAGVSKSIINSILQEFEKENIILIEKLSKIWRIKANQTNNIYMKNKIIYNLSTIYNSGLVEYLTNHFNNPKSIILFGSYRKGEDISSSDIDIAIESDDFEEYSSVGLRELIEFENYFDRKIQLHLFNRNNIDINLFNNIANGIVLFGFLEVKK